MRGFVIEAYQAAPGPGELDELVRRLARAAAVLPEGGAVRLVRLLFLPLDETCLYVFEAESPARVREAARRAGLVFERVTEALELWPTPS